MSKLNIYRAVVLIGLAVIFYLWHLAIPWIVGSWALALLAALFRMLNLPDTGAGRHSFRGTGDACLSAWLGVWNGFYVWKDLDEDYWARQKAEAAAEDASKRDALAAEVRNVDDN